MGRPESACSIGSPVYRQDRALNAANPCDLDRQAPAVPVGVMKGDNGTNDDASGLRVPAPVGHRRRFDCRDGGLPTNVHGEQAIGPSVESDPIDEWIVRRLDPADLWVHGVMVPSCAAAADVRDFGERVRCRSSSSRKLRPVESDGVRQGSSATSPAGWLATQSAISSVTRMSVAFIVACACSSHVGPK
jgi:hypothetical protein